MLTKAQTVLALSSDLDALTEPIFAGIDAQVEALTSFIVESNDLEFLNLSVVPDYILNGQKYLGTDDDELTYDAVLIYSLQLEVAQASTESLLSIRIDIPSSDAEGILKKILANPNMLVDALINHSTIGS